LQDAQQENSCLLGINARTEELVSRAQSDNSAARLINHTCKRVMTNTAQGCEIVLAKRKQHGFSDGGGYGRVESVLQQTRQGAVFGYHMDMARATLMHGILFAGEYNGAALDQCDAFELSHFFDGLGLNHDRRFARICVDDVCVRVPIGVPHGHGALASALTLPGILITAPAMCV
jgi:hypothetical protein